MPQRVAGDLRFDVPRLQSVDSALAGSGRGRKWHKTDAANVSTDAITILARAAANKAHIPKPTASAPAGGPPPYWVAGHARSRLAVAADVDNGLKHLIDSSLTKGLGLDDRYVGALVGGKTAVEGQKYGSGGLRLLWLPVSSWVEFNALTDAFHDLIDDALDRILLAAQE